MRKLTMNIPADSIWHGYFFPVALLILSALASAGFKWWELRTDILYLENARAALQPKIEKSRNLRAQLDSLARQTAILAEQGNPNARELVAELARNGIAIHANAQTPTDAKQ
jgi:hypothetical protein